MLSRFVLAFLLALPFSVAALVPALQAEQQSFLTIRMWSSVGGLLQVYFDTGKGFNGNEVVHMPLRPSEEAVDYRVPMPSGIYQALRIDPGESDGRHVIERIAVETASGDTVATIPLADVQAAYHVVEGERTPSKLTVDVPPGAYDPQLYYKPASPMPVLPGAAPLGRQLLFVAAYIGLALLVVFGGERAFSRLAPYGARVIDGMGRWGPAHPSATVLIVATLATFIDAYPVLLFERSFVTPNNGGTLMLYDQAPFVPGSADFEVEDARGNDVGAMMWAFVPYSKVQREALAQGEFPLWNRYNAAGRPLWSQGQTFLFDPLHWLTLVSPDLAAGWDLKFVAHRLVFAWGCGVAVLVATGAWLPAAAAAAAAPFIGLFAYRFNHPAAFAVTYMPWALAGWFLIAAAASRRQAARGALGVALASSLMLLSSPPKEAALLIAATQATGLLAVLFQGGPIRLLGMRMAAGAAAGLVLLLVTTPHWLMFLDALRESGTASDVPSIGLAAFGFILAFALGTLAPGGWFVGAHLLVLTLGAALALTPLKLVKHRALLASAAGCALLMAMAFGVIPEPWMMRLPLLPRIGHLYDIALAGAAVFAILATAIGADSLRTSSRVRAWATTGLVAAAVGWLVVRVVEQTSVYRFEPWAVVAVGLMATSLPLLVKATQHAPTRVLPFVACAGVVLCILLPGGLHLETGLPLVDRMLVQPRLRVMLDQDSPTVDAIAHAMTQPARAAGVNYAFFPGSQALYQTDGIAGPDALFVPEYEALVNAAGIERPWIWLTVVSAADVARMSPLLDLLNVGFLVGRMASLPPGLPMERLTQPDLVHAVRRPSAWPRAFFVDTVSTYDEPADFMKQVAERGGPMAAVQASDSIAVDLTRDLPASGGSFVAADDYAITTNSTRFRVRAPGPGIAVLTETYLPRDFTVTINGRPASYFRVNHAFKGVRLPGRGDWDIRFEYRPAHWGLAWMAAGIGGLLALALAAAAVWPQRTRASVPLGQAAVQAPAWDAFGVSRD